MCTPRLFVLTWFATFSLIACGTPTQNGDACTGTNCTDAADAPRGDAPVGDAMSDAQSPDAIDATIDAADVPDDAPSDTPHDACADVTCTSPAHGTASCVAGACVLTCDTGYSELGGVCVAGTTCNGARCLAGQHCSATGCAFDCTGVHVPGDYPTIQAAETALASTGGTICLGPGTYPAATISAPHPLTVIGASPEMVMLGDVTASSTVTLRGLTMASLSTGLPYYGAQLTIEGCRILHGVVATDSTSSGAGSISVTLDGCDIGPGATSGVGVSGSNSTGGAGVTIALLNPFVHGASQFGVDLYGNNATLSAMNDTLTDNATGIHTHFATRVSIVNDLIVGSNVALQLDSAPVGAYSNLALWHDTTNYAGVATPPPGVVTTDPMLDTATPPAPSALSPLRGAGTSAGAPPADYWGVSRASRVDIGAVQAP